MIHLVADGSLRLTSNKTCIMQEMLEVFVGASESIQPQLTSATGLCQRRLHFCPLGLRRQAMGGAWALANFVGTFWAFKLRKLVDLGNSKQPWW